jgi:YD repeat-containing protein
MVTATAAFGQTPQVRYFRHLAINHNSPYASFEPLNEIDAGQAKGVEHYEVFYDAQGRVSEMRNYSSEAWRNHPLTHMGSFRMTVSREGRREVRVFFDREGKRTHNLRQVYKEIYGYDAKGALTSLEFYDLADKPMDSNWGVARYTWEKKADMIIERRYNVKGELMPLAPTFAFHISGLKLDRDGRIVEHYNLNDKLEIVDNADGIACYKDMLAANGALVNVSYYDQKGRLTNSPWRFAAVRQTYDKDGNVIVEEMIDKFGLLLSRENFNYDAAGKLLPKP